MGAGGRVGWGGGGEGATGSVVTRHLVSFTTGMRRTLEIPRYGDG